MDKETKNRLQVELFIIITLWFNKDEPTTTYYGSIHPRKLAQRVRSCGLNVKVEYTESNVIMYKPETKYFKK